MGVCRGGQEGTFPPPHTKGSFLTFFDLLIEFRTPEPLTTLEGSEPVFEKFLTLPLELMMKKREKIAIIR